MSRNGNCWDNAVSESFSASRKLELVFKFNSRRAARDGTCLNIAHHSMTRRRRHSSLGYRSSADFEQSDHRRLAA
jgi:putative transposase